MVNFVLAGIIAVILFVFQGEWDYVNTTSRQIIDWNVNFALFLVVLCGIIAIYCGFYIVMALKCPDVAQVPILSILTIVFTCVLEVLLLIFLIEIDWISVYEIYSLLGDGIGNVLYIVMVGLIITMTIFLTYKMPKLKQQYKTADSKENTRQLHGRFSLGLRPQLILDLIIVWGVLVLPFLSILAFQHPRLTFWEYYLSRFKWMTLPVFIHIISFGISAWLLFQIFKRQKNKKSKRVVWFFSCVIVQIVSLVIFGIQQGALFAIYNPLFFLTASYGLLGFGIFLQKVFHSARDKKTVRSKNGDSRHKKTTYLQPENISGLFLILVIIIPIAGVGLYQPVVGLMPRSIEYSTDVPVVQNTYNNLTHTQKILFDEVLNHEMSQAQNITEYLSDHRGTRTAVRTASGLLFRNEEGDAQNATEILQWLLLQQRVNKTDKRTFGAWKSSPNNENIDRNWREFIGCELILIVERHSNKIPNTLVESINQSLVMAAQGAQWRDVSPTYTNIALMTAFLMNYVGVKMDKPLIRETGLLKAWHCYNLFNRQEAFCEFNSPTYDGVSMVALALWRELGPCEEMRTMGREMELAFWENIALFYHPGFKNMVGPFFRSYGMDMTKYNAIIGIWMALALEDFNSAPLPRTSGAGYFELSNVLTAVQVGHSLSQKTKEQLLHFNNSRVIKKEIPTALDLISKTHEVSAILTKDWMMGGVKNLHKQPRESLNQIKAGTLYWNSTIDNSLAWLMVPSFGFQQVEVKENQMRIWREDGNSSLMFHVNGKTLDLSSFTTNQWNLLGLNLSVSAEPSNINASIMDPGDFSSSYRVGHDLDTIVEIRCKLSEITLKII